MKDRNLYRTQVLLEPDQFKQLSSLAESEGVSLSALLRRIVAQALSDRRQKELAKAAEKLLDLYYSDGELVGYASLDGEEFPLKD